MNDERHGQPSVSAFPQYEACRGSFILQKAAPPELEREGTTFGTRVHGGMDGSLPESDLTNEEREAVEGLKAREQAYLDLLAQDGWEVVHSFREERLWRMPDPSAPGNWSGKPDRLLVVRKGKEYGGVVIDYKSTHYAGRAAENLQLVGLACLFIAWYEENNPEIKLDSMRVLLVYPDAFDPHQYGRDTIYKMLAQCDSLVEIITGSEAHVRTPSTEACRWCKAKGICPEANAQLTELVTVQQEVALPMSRELLARCEIAKQLIDDIRERATAILSEGGEIEGYELKEGSLRTKITNPTGVYERAATLGVDGKMFADACSLTKTSLKALIKEVTGKNGKELDEMIDGLLDGNITQNRTKPSLAKIKEAA